MAKMKFTKDTIKRYIEKLSARHNIEENESLSNEMIEPVGKLKITGIGRKFKKLSQKQPLKRVSKKARSKHSLTRTWREKRALAKRTQRLRKFIVVPLAHLLLPIVFILGLIVIRFAYIPERAADSVGVKSLEAPGFPISVVFDKKQDCLGTTWIKTPGGVCHIEDTDDLNLVSEEIKLLNADMDSKKDLLWRLNFTNKDGIGVTLWIGMSTESSKIYICKTPIVPSRWHALPLKLDVPEKMSLYFSPTTPIYQDSARQYIGREAYTFLYTVTLTQDGPAFVPIPSVYNEIFPIFTEILMHEPIAEKRAVYKKMQLDFARLSKGLPLSIAAYKNIRMDTVEVMSWKN